MNIGSDKECCSKWIPRRLLAFEGASFVLMLEVRVVFVLRWNVFFVEAPPVDPVLLCVSCVPL